MKVKPIEFKEQNVIFAKDQKEYLPLPAFRDKNDEYGNVICCWELSLKERIKLLFTGKMWLNLMSFNNPLTPHRLAVDKWELLNKEYFK